MEIKGDPIEIKSATDHIYNFLNDFNNFENLMPEQISHWKSDTDSCSFEINNMATIELRITEREHGRKLKMNSEGKSPFPFQLISKLEPLNENLSKFSFEIDAEVNPMLSMMVKKPLQNLVEIMGQKLKTFMEK